MAEFKEIKTTELKENPFQMIGKDWLLVSAESEGRANSMTASWGGLGVMWGKDVAFIVLRPQRFTKTLIDKEERFTLSVLDRTVEANNQAYAYLGKVTGANEDKIAGCGLTLAHDSADAPYFEEAKTVLVCKKLFAQPYDPDGFIAKELDDKWYPGKDYHTMYIAEIEKVLVKE